MTVGTTAVFRYSPKRAVIVDSAVVVIMSFLVLFFIWTDVWPLSIVMGFVLLRSLRELALASVIEVSYREPDMIYRRSSLFRKQVVEIPAWKISGTETRIVSMWKGSIREKLVLCADGREFLLHPFYSSRDPGTATVYQDIHSLKYAGEAFLERKTRKAEQEAEEQMERSKVEKTVWGMVEMSIQCPRCEAHVPVNGPYNDFICAECSERIELPPDSWADLLEDVRDETAYELDQGEGSKSSIMGVFNTALFYGRLVPYCSKCKEDFHMDDDYTEGNDSVVCSSCGNSLPVTPPPEWFNRVFEGARLIVGATRSTDSKDTAAEPVVLTCPGCSAPFETTGEARNIPCPHCDNSVFLPDDLWYHFHPVPVKRRWFVGFTASFDPEDG